MAKKKNKRSSSSSNEIESKKTKKKKMRGVGRGINSLPDNILHHVLSFLTMREAIQTSLVSKRWRYLWTSLPTLNFTKINGKEKEFVNTVLLLRDIRSNLQRFSITDSFNESSETPSDSDDDGRGKKPDLRLNIWILTAIRCNVEEIHLEFYFSESVVLKLPHCLFTCNSLKKLELISMDSNKPQLILPDSISLPMLQILHIERFTLNHNEEGDFKINDLISNCCPALESLTLCECGIQTKNLNIVAHNLKHLVINENLSKKQQFMEHGEATGSVSLYVPNLISFHCKDYLSKSYCLENVSSLVEAYIDMKMGKGKKRILKKGRQVMIRGKKMINFKILHNVKHLQLSAWALQIFIATYGSSSDSASIEFHNLRSLEIETWLSGDCMCGITSLLHISPNIIKLSVKIIEDTITPVFPQWDQINLNPADIGDNLKLPLQCMLDHLKYVEIRGLMRTVNEIKFLEVLLKNAVVLEELIVGFSPGEYFRERQLIMYILHSFPRASSSAIEAHIDMKLQEEEENLKARILKKGRNVMIRGKKKMISFGILHNVKHLKLSAWALQLPMDHQTVRASTEFHNLRSLELETWLSRKCIRGITHLLHISPNIVKLSLEIIKDTVMTPVFPQWDEIKLNPADIGDYLKLSLHCMLDHLKYVEIRGLMGTVNELKFLEVLLKNAVVLEELIVGFAPGEHFRERQLIKNSKILQSFPRASSSATILFIS